ncbi:MAG TPA: pyridine nucleotide-disulfide oxidoreductase, partial [Papillibacter sp.]|nr:pyridine nucleotide-disulfide oxidoreductase [Papillibacter sp.]
MRPFNHINASTVDEAVSALKGNNLVISGGTDLLGTLKDNLLMNYPATVVNVKSIPGMDYIKEEEGALTIGANTRLTDIAENPLVQEKYTALAQAARKVATPNIRNMGTIAGTIAQMPRCWYFRKSENRFPCLRKGGEECYAITGDNRYHSIFGGIKVGSSSCTLKCPAQTDIPGYFALIRDGRWDEAA